MWGGPELHATAGASVVGARSFLIAYNVYLGPGSDISHARAVARAIRASSGGMQGVKALGVLAERARAGDDERDRLPCDADGGSLRHGAEAGGEVRDDGGGGRADRVDPGGGLLPGRGVDFNDPGL